LEQPPGQADQHRRLDLTRSRHVNIRYIDSDVRSQPRRQVRLSGSADQDDPAVYLLEELAQLLVAADGVGVDQHGPGADFTGQLLGVPHEVARYLLHVSSLRGGVRSVRDRGVLLVIPIPKEESNPKFALVGAEK